jgi:SAM-dependent methyltransferase
VPDRIFADPRLARMYDPLDPDRSDLDAYLALVDELGASSVLDVGCGTGTFACLLAQRDVDVVGVDPAEASLDVARTKPGADRVRWLIGDATTLPALRVDLATMTGNVAQVLLGDDDLRSTLVGIRRALAPGGHVAFEVRDPARQAWRSWTRERSWARTVVPHEGPVESWVEVTSVDLPFVSFRSMRRIEATGEVLTSDSTLRFRDRTEVERAIDGAGLDVVDVRDAPDRPGLEHVFLCAVPDRS